MARGDQTQLSCGDVRTIVRILSIIGLLVGITALYLGLSGSSGCPAQVIGQPPNCPNPFQAEVAAGIVIIILSAVGLVASFLWPGSKPKDNAWDQRGPERR